MNVQKWTFGFWIFSVLAFHGVTTSAQELLEPVLLPIAPPAINPIDPAALNAVPVFGNSGPVTRPKEPVAAQEPPTREGTTWIPKLRVVLVTSVSRQTEVLVPSTASQAGNLFPSFEAPKPVIQKTTRTVELRSQNSVILTCEDVNVEAAASENGELTYTFSCKCKAVLTIDGFTVTGDSISASDGKLTITNAVIKSDQAILTSEKMVLQLPILGVQVGAANPSDSLQPTLDPINEQKRNNGASRPFSIDLDASPPINKDAAVFPPST